VEASFGSDERVSVVRMLERTLERTHSILDLYLYLRFVGSIIA
jgi:hypothetical protein